MLATLKVQVRRVPESVRGMLAQAALFILYFALVASMLTVAMPHLGGFARNLLFSECIGLAILGWGGVLRRVPFVRGLNFLASLILSTALAAPVGYAMGRLLGLMVLGERLRVLDWGEARVVPYMATVLMAILGMGFVAMRDQSVKEVAARSEAQLRLLRAQLEPHMLFNTLATLRSLVDDDPKQAQTMIDQVIAYLRSSLAASRVEATTLRNEFDQLHAYLQIMSLRMGPRLTYTLDLPHLLQVEAIPSMLLQPLVENAIKHGLEPKVGNGWVGVVAKRTTDGLEISVTDSGVGLTSEDRALPTGKLAVPSKGSYGMLHVRERLKAVYGPAATVTLAAHQPHGACATVRIPQ